MIATREEIKALLKITNTDNDSFIDLNIPIVEQIIVDYCNTDFVDKEFDYFSSGSITFLASDNSINMTNIINKDLAVGDTIRVYKSFRNNFTFTVDSIATDKIIVNSIDTIKEEDEDKGVFITRILYPRPLKSIAAKMMQYLISELDDDKTVGVESEKIDDYSIKYEDNFNGFPMSIMTKLNNYKCLYKRDLFN